jgi:hypothetical protein
MRSATPLLVATLLLTVLVGAAAAPADDLPEHDRWQIADLAQRYLQHRADKVTNTPQPPGFGVPITERMAAELHDDEIRLVARRNRYLELGGSGFSRAEVRTNLRRAEVAPDGSVVVHVQEVTELYYARDAYTYRNTSFSLTHVLVFDRTTTGWALATDTRPPGTTCKVPAETEFCDRSGER